MKLDVSIVKLQQRTASSGTKRLSHLNFKTMNSLVKKELVRGLPDMEFYKGGLCEACEKGKSKKASHRSKRFNKHH